MNANLIWLAIYASIALYSIALGASKLLGAISPGYRIRREQKRDERMDRSIANSRRKKASRKARNLEWARKHSNRPEAKRLLAEEAAEAEHTAKMAALTHATSEDVVSQEPLEVLRRRQRSDDEYERRCKERAEADALLSQQLLEYALANPSAPETARHLREVREKAVDQLGDAERSIRHYEYMLGVAGELEKIEYTTRLEDATARKDAAQRRIREISEALSGFSSPSEQ